jgi:hypothetical protein
MAEIDWEDRDIRAAGRIAPGEPAPPPPRAGDRRPGLATLRFRNGDQLVRLPWNVPRIAPPTGHS